MNEADTEIYKMDIYICSYGNSKQEGIEHNLQEVGEVFTQ